MLRRIVLAMSLVLVVAACGGQPAAFEPMQLFVDSPVEIPTVGTPDPTKVGNWMPRYEEIGGLRRFAFTDGDRFVISTEAGERDFVAGTNIGPTIPGHFPGEQAIRLEDFRRWFPMMSDLGIQAVRVYTIMPPHFYEELAAFNTAHPTRPLLVVHGVWIPEQPFYQRKDLYDPELITAFQQEMERAVHRVEYFETGGYAWEAWQSVTWHERLKAGVDVFADAVITANRPRLPSCDGCAQHGWVKRHKNADVSRSAPLR